MSKKPRKRISLKWSDEARETWKQTLAFYTRRNRSTAYSRKLDARLRQILALLLDNTEMGEQTKEENVRRFTFENYAVFYRVKENYLEVIAVVDARRNVDLD